MKILQISAHFYPNIGGVETHLIDLVDELLLQQHKLTVLTYRPLMNDVSWKLFESRNNLKIFRIPWIRGLFNKLLKYPILEFLYLVTGLFFVLPIFLISEKYNCIHAHGLASSFVSVIWGKIFNIRVIISTHSVYQFPKSGFYRKTVTQIFKNANKVLCLSEQSKKEIIDLGVKKDRVEKFTYWIDLQKFHPINKSKAKDRLKWTNKFIVLYVGRLVPEKGLPELLEATKKTSDQITFAIIGSGQMSNKLSQLSQKNIKFIGPVSQDNLPVYYSAADLLIVPSTHEEGFGRVIIESLACGTPVIGANRGAIPEAMTEEVGRIIDITAENISKTIHYIYRHPKVLSSLASHTRKFAERNYSRKNIHAITNTYD